MKTTKKALTLPPQPLQPNQAAMQSAPQSSSPTVPTQGRGRPVGSVSSRQNSSGTQQSAQVGFVQPSIVQQMGYQANTMGQKGFGNTPTHQTSAAKTASVLGELAGKLRRRVSVQLN